jgi:hypothetical protein
VPRGRDGFDAAPAEQYGQAQADEAEGRLRVLRQPQLIVIGGRQQAAQVDVGG